MSPVLLALAVLADAGRPSTDGVDAIDPTAFTNSGVCLEGATVDAFEACFAATDPTADRTITIPNWTGTVVVPSGLGSSGQVSRSAGTSQPTWSTATFPDTCTANQLDYCSATDTHAGLASCASGVLVTSAGSVPSCATDIPTAVTIGTAYVYRVGGTDVALLDGGTNKSMTAVNGGVVWTDADSQEVSAAGTSNQVLQSAGAAAPTWTSGLSQSSEVTLTEGFEATGDYDTACTATASFRQDIDGEQSCGPLTDALPTPLALSGAFSAPLATGANQTGASITIRPGTGTKKAAMTAASWVNNTTTFTVTIDGTANTGTEGTNFECDSVTDTVCANNVANYYETLAGAAGIHACSSGSTTTCTTFGFTGVAGTAYFWPAPEDSPGKYIDSIAISTGAGAVLTNGTNGSVTFNGVGFQSANANGPYIENAAASSTNPTLCPDQSDKTRGFGVNTSALSAIIAGAEASRFTATAFLFPDGSAATAPGFGFLADTNNGGWRFGTDQWQLVAGGIGAIALDGGTTKTYTVTVNPGAVTATSGDTYSKLYVDNLNAVTLAGANTVIASLRVDEPNITDPGAPSCVDGASVYIEAAPTECTNNYALDVVSGATNLAGTLAVGGNTTLSAAYIGSTQALSGPGAANVTTETTKITTTGVADAITLADGTNGQTKIVVHDVDGGSFVLTPTTKTGWSTFTSTVVGETIALKFVTTRGWMVTGSYLGVIAP